jgi:hypothetical protein
VCEIFSVNLISELFLVCIRILKKEKEMEKRVKRSKVRCERNGKMAR